MAITTVPTESGVCRIIGQMADKDIVLATSEDDFKDWSACELGAKIADNPAMVGDGYDYLVLNPDTDCIERYPKPAPPVYNSELLDPWFGSKHYSGSLGTTVGLNANQKLDLPTFAYDVNLFVTYSIAIDADKVEFDPGGPIQTPGVTMGTLYEGYERLPVIKESAGYAMRNYYRKVFVKAGQSSLYLAIYLWNGGGAGWSHFYVSGVTSINAIAFKA